MRSALSSAISASVVLLREMHVGFGNLFGQHQTIVLHAARLSELLELLRAEHLAEVLAALVNDVQSMDPQQILVTGDLTHLGLPREFAQAARWLQALESLRRRTEEAARAARPNLEAVARGLRSGAEVEVLVNDTGRPFVEIMKESSADADMIFLGMRQPGEDYVAYYERLRHAAEGMPTTAFVLASEDLPFGEIVLYPRALDDLLTTSKWLEQIRDTWDSDTRLHLPEFGKTLVLYSQALPEA